MAAALPPAESEVPLWRLHLIRIACVYFAGWGIFNIHNPLLIPIPGILFSLLVAHLIARYAEPWTRARIVALASLRGRIQAPTPAG